MSGSRRFYLGALPTVAFCVIGYLGLANIRRGRYEIQDEKDKQLRSANTERKKFSIEEEYEIFRRKHEIDNFQNVRIRRPAGYEQ
eukprot:EC720512.1.p2 GENE.EC720512.1~~EC720512.1.p2  ORF type:complete len:85 (+),score=9.28 EC720512.1:116-370(+)